MDRIARDRNKLGLRTVRLFGNHELAAFNGDADWLRRDHAALKTKMAGLKVLETPTNRPSEIRVPPSQDENTKVGGDRKTTMLPGQDSNLRPSD